MSEERDRGRPMIGKPLNVRFTPTQVRWMDTQPGPRSEVLRDLVQYAKESGLEFPRGSGSYALTKKQRLLISNPPIKVTPMDTATKVMGNPEDNIVKVGVLQEGDSFSFHAAEFRPEGVYVVEAIRQGEAGVVIETRCGLTATFPTVYSPVVIAEG